MSEQSLDLTDPRMLRHTAEHLCDHYAGVFFPELVERCVAASYTELARTARIQAYLAPMALHDARERLRALAAARAGTDPATVSATGWDPVQQVLFVDDEDTGPAAIAAAMLAELAGPTVVTCSAGTIPAAAVDPYAARVLAEHGVHSGTRPKPVTADLVRAADWVITLGSVDPPSPRPGAHHQAWPVDSTLDEDRGLGLVADLESRVQALHLEITAAATAGPASQDPAAQDRAAGL